MMKLSLALVSVLALASLTGCSGSSDSRGSDQQSEDPSTESAPPSQDDSPRASSSPSSSSASSSSSTPPAAPPSSSSASKMTCTSTTFACGDKGLTCNSATEYCDLSLPSDPSCMKGGNDPMTYCMEASPILECHCSGDCNAGVLCK